MHTQSDGDVEHLEHGFDGLQGKALLGTRFASEIFRGEASEIVDDSAEILPTQSTLYDEEYAVERRWRLSYRSISGWSS